MSDQPKPKRKYTVSDKVRSRNSRAGIARSKQRTSQDYRDMVNKRFKKEVE